jgi:MazG family protein
VGAGERNAAALARLDELTRLLRRECPWDREQDERSIVPHTVEEAYELADAAQRGDDAKLLDELGDVLFQVHFLSLLLEERGAGDLAAVADHCHAKLVRRHPHVFPAAASGASGTGGSVEVEGASEVLRNWDRIKQDEAGREPGLFGEVPENLPGPLFARKVQRRAASSGFDWPDAQGPLASVREELAEVEEAAAVEQPTDRGPSAGRDPRFDEVGDLLFAAVSVARKLRVDPELALRASADRFRERVERAAGLAAREGTDWAELTPERQIELYSQSR